MALASVLVFVAKPSHLTYAEAMNRLRMWLDYKRIEPVGFRITANGPIGFDISFASERDAAAFELFSWS